MTRPSAKREDYEERAAILEYEACLPRDQAEALAREMVYGKPKPKPAKRNKVIPGQGDMFG